MKHAYEGDLEAVVVAVKKDLANTKNVRLVKGGCGWSTKP